jgi:hypothetical protein
VASTCHCGNHKGNGLPLATVVVSYDLIFFTYPGFSGFETRKNVAVSTVLSISKAGIRFA